MRKEVKWFAELMEKKLQENDHKKGWKDVHPITITEYLCDQFQKMSDAIFQNLNKECDKWKHDEIIKRCVNLSNYSMMLADLIEIEKKNKKLTPEIF